MWLIVEGYPELDTLGESLTVETPECHVFARLEAYSCKDTTRDRKLRRDLEASQGIPLRKKDEEASENQEKENSSSDSDGSRNQSQAQETYNIWFMLISLLNLSFPEHDFSGVPVEDFTQEPSALQILHQLSSTLTDLRATKQVPIENTNYTANTSDPIFKTLDAIMSIGECRVYAYHPDHASDPHALAENEPDSQSDDSDLGPININTSERRRKHDPFAYMREEPSVPNTPQIRSGTQTPVWSRTQSETSLLASAPPSVFGDASGGLLWSSNYFFFNKRLKRVLYLTIWARSHGATALSTSPLPVNPFRFSKKKRQRKRQ